VKQTKAYIQKTTLSIPNSVQGIIMFYFIFPAELEKNISAFIKKRSVKKIFLLIKLVG